MTTTELESTTTGSVIVESEFVVVVFGSAAVNERARTCYRGLGLGFEVRARIRIRVNPKP